MIQIRFMENKEIYNRTINKLNNNIDKNKNISDETFSKKIF